MVTVEQLPLPQVGVLTSRLRVPVVSQVLVNPPHALQLPKVTVPHDNPLVLRVQDSLWEVVTVPQLPPPQVGVYTSRPRVPVVSQVPANPPHEPQPPYVTVPHDVPLVLRVQASVWTVVVVVQLPLPQVGVLTSRLRVPVVSQVPANPPQLLHAPRVTLPQDPPSVSRMHERELIELASVQVPLWQAYSLTERACVPVSSQEPE